MGGWCITVRELRVYGAGMLGRDRTVEFDTNAFEDLA